MALNKWKWTSIALLSVILPISLLITFRLTGITPEPPTPQIIMLETTNWQMERPSETTDFDWKIKKNYEGGEISVNICVNVAVYRENTHPLECPFYGNDGIVLVTYVNATATRGLIVSMSVKYCPMDANAVLTIGEDGMVLSNATLANIEKVAMNSNEAFVLAKTKNTPCNLRIQSYWVFSDQNCEEHWLTVTSEVLYFNGTKYKKIAAPIILLVWPDVGNEFETARSIAASYAVGDI